MVIMAMVVMMMLATMVIILRNYRISTRTFTCSSAYKKNSAKATESLSCENRPLTEQQTRSLAKGLNYNTKDADKLDYVADLESALKNSGLTDETKEHIRHQITTNLHNKRPVKLDTEEQKAIKDLQSNDEIIILPADKGRMTVIMNKLIISIKQTPY
ncbi:Hypothetical predicted protein [Paramuricea clavata]|uniref:Uncharacterized protein n=1 Tax=Paramuricea clavata TaxID=317549 RepID=A0A6S7LKI9_PARCT|nr:Hypothetical predicted protein [Paramuricea clavata]